MVPEKEISEVIIEATKALGKIENCIEKTWDETKKEGNYAWWWDEEELILPFYFHLRPKIEELNNNLKKICLYIIPEYALKASSYAGGFGEKYPVLKRGRKEYRRTKKVDLSIVAFDRDDFERKKTDSRMTYWYVRHAPVVLMEFKLLSKARARAN